MNRLTPSAELPAKPAVPRLPLPEPFPSKSDGDIARRLAEAYYFELAHRGFDKKAIINVCIEMLDCLLDTDMTPTGEPARPQK